MTITVIPNINLGLLTLRKEQSGQELLKTQHLIPGMDFYKV